MKVQNGVKVQNGGMKVQNGGMKVQNGVKVQNPSLGNPGLTQIKKVYLQSQKV